MDVTPYVHGMDACSPHAGGTEGGQQVWAPAGLVLVVPRNSPRGGAEKVTQKPDREGKKWKERAGLHFSMLSFYLFLIAPRALRIKHP